MKWGDTTRTAIGMDEPPQLSDARRAECLWQEWHVGIAPPVPMAAPARAGVRLPTAEQRRVMWCLLALWTAAFVFVVLFGVGRR